MVRCVSGEKLKEETTSKIGVAGTSKIGGAGTQKGTEKFSMINGEISSLYINIWS
jgi:hypothetical protein